MTLSFASATPHRRNYNVPGHAHSLTFSCYKRYPFLSKDRTCEWLADSIEKARSDLNFDLWAWVFMPDHAHLVIHPRNEIYDIAVIRRLIKEPAAQKAIKWSRNNSLEWLRKIERQRGDRLECLFWQSGGGYDRNITEGRTLMATIDYVHHNPVRKGLIANPQDWKWSSAAWYYDGSPVPMIPDPIPPEWLVDV